MTWTSLCRWALADYWPALVLLLAGLAWRHCLLWRVSHSGLLADRRRSHALALLNSSTLVPVLTWGLLANRFSQIVMETHAWSQPRLLLSSQQLFVCALMVLGLMIGMDCASRLALFRRIKEPEYLHFPVGVLIVVLVVVVDWLLSELAWWSLITWNMAGGGGRS